MIRDLLMAAVTATLTFSAIAQHGTVDNSFNYYDTSLFQNFDFLNDEVRDIVQQPDGKFIVCGSFNNFTPGSQFSQLVRLNPNGSVDPSLAYLTISGNQTVTAVRIQTDGKILVGGYFSSFAGQSGSFIRLNSDGTQDISFTLGVVDNMQIEDVEIQADGKIIVSGNFSFWNGAVANGIVRLNQDGSLDNSFDIGTGPSGGTITKFDITPNGDILVCGSFTSFDGQANTGYVKLSPSGSLSSTFTTGVSNNTWRDVKVLDNEEILLVHSVGVLKLNPNGDLNSSFNQGLSNSVLNGVTVLSNNKIVVYGRQDSYMGINSGKITLLNADGTVDPSFSVQTAGGNGFTQINAVVEQPSGNLIFGGDFQTVNSVSCPMISMIQPNALTPPGIQGVYGTVNTVSVQPDNKIIVAGNFSGYFEVGTPTCIRLGPNGELDTAFVSNIGTGPAGIIYDSYLLENGQILIAGSFSQFDGNACSRIARINQDGFFDTNFVPPVFTQGVIYSIDVQTDGKILVAGDFQYIDGSLQYYVARLDANGSLDTSFTSELFANVVFQMQAYKIQQLESGDILVGGRFGCCDPLIKLNPDGTINPSFYYNLSYNRVHDFVELDDNSLIVGGVSYSGSQSAYFVRKRKSDGSFYPGASEIIGSMSNQNQGFVKSLHRISDTEICVTGNIAQSQSGRDVLIINNDCVRDLTFDVPEGFDGYSVNDSGMQSDGRIIVVGGFENIGAFRKNGVARLNRSFAVVDTVCANTPYQFGTQTILTQSSGVYTEVFQSSINTDSTVILSLEVINDVSISFIDDSTIASNCQNCVYQWLDCDNGYQPIPSATNATLSVSQPGNYAVVVDNGQCSDTSDCFYLSLLGGGADPLANLKIYPNPTSDLFFIEKTMEGDMKIYLYNAVGGVVKFLEAVDNRVDIRVDDLTKGVYMLHINMSGEIVHKKIVVN